MTDQDRIANLISAIWYQHPFWPSTFGPCANDGCSGSARGSRECKQCLKKQLADLTCKELADEFFHVLAMCRNLEHELVEKR